jgi:hypothetical protein
MNVLPNDYARCDGVRSKQQCKDCKRSKQLQIDKKRTDVFRTSHMQPPQAAFDDKCGFFIGDDK